MLSDKEEVQLLSDILRWGSELKEKPDLPLEDVAKVTQLAPDSERLRNLMGWLELHKEANPANVRADVLKDRKIRRLTADNNSWKSKYKFLLKEHDFQAKELDAAKFLYSQDSRIEPLVIKPSQPSQTSEAVAIVVASDWHVEEEVKPEKVNHRNKYNLEIAERRARTFFERTLRMVKKEQQDVHIDTLILALLGDFITGNIHEENLETCLLGPMDAILFVRRLIEGGIQFLLDNSNLNLLIPCRPGNHSRITRKVRASTEDENALETLMYATLADTFKNERRVQFELQRSYHCLVQVYDYTLRFHHGHAVRYGGGVGGLSIPLNKALAEWDKGLPAHVDMLGHWHTYLPTRRFVVNGSLIGYSPYAVRIKASFEPPIQAFFLLDKKRGTTVQIPLYVDT